MFLESVPLIFSFAWLTAFLSGLFLLAAREVAPFQGAAKLGARMIGSLSGVAALFLVPSMLEGPALFLVFLLMALIFVAAVGWRPVRVITRAGNAVE